MSEGSPYGNDRRGQGSDFSAYSARRDRSDNTSGGYQKVTERKREREYDSNSSRSGDSNGYQRTNQGQYSGYSGYQRPSAATDGNTNSSSGSYYDGTYGAAANSSSYPPRAQPGYHQQGQSTASRPYNTGSSYTPQQSPGSYDQSSRGYSSYRPRNDRQPYQDRSRNRGYPEHKQGRYNNNGYNGNSSYHQSSSYNPDGRYNNHSSYSNNNGYNHNRRQGYNQRDQRDHRTETQAAVVEQEEEEEEKEEEVQNLPERIAYYKAKLEELKDSICLEEITGIDSKWGVKPKGFEKVTAQRAKLSGLFPLPGYPRPVDLTKLEGIVKDGTLNGSLLLPTSKLDPNGSKASKIVTISGINFDNVDYLKVTDEINKLLLKVDVPPIHKEQNVENKWKTRDNQSMMIEFVNNSVATICLCFSGSSIRVDGVELSLTIQRPSDYIAQGYLPEEDENKDPVPDNAYKVVYKVGTEYEEPQVKEAIQSVSSVKSYHLLSDKSTRESLGIAFVNYDIDYSNSKAALMKIQETISKTVTSSPMFQDGKFACLIPNSTSIQEKAFTLKTLQSFVKNLEISTTVADPGSEIIKDVIRDNKKSNVIQLINAVTAKDLVDDENFNFISQDIRHEVEKFGKVITVKIPRPANDYTPGLTQFSQPGVGKIFVEFVNEEVALDAIMGIAGRTYNDRTVLCSFYDSDDFKKNILLGK